MIEIKNLTKKYGKNIVLNDVSINIKNNSITFLMGENGSGKTSLIKSILNLEGYQGQVVFNNKKIEDVYGEISAIYDDSPLYQHLSGYQNVIMLCSNSLKKKDIDCIALQFLNKSELNKSVSKYSFGQRKKLSVIIALLSNPKYVFMDEVSNGLDYETMQQLRKILREFSKERLIFLTGHQFDFYNEIIDYVFVIKDKNITEYKIEDFTDKERMLEKLYEKNISDSKK